jgi:hypothetical protein
MKKIYFTLGILLLGTIAMAYLYFSNLNTERNANELSLNAVTKNTGMVFCFDNDKSFYEILSGQQLLQNVLGERKSAQLKSLRVNLIDQPKTFNAFEGQKVYIGFLAGANNEVDYLIATQLKPNQNQKQLLQHFGTKLVSIKNEPNIYQFSFNDSTTVFVGVKNALVLVSNALTGIQQAMADQENSNHSFADYVKANSRFNKNTLANLYLDFNQIPKLLKPILNSNLTGELSVFNRQKSFATLSYNFGKEKILFNGTTIVNDANDYNAMFANMPAQKLTISHILPKNTANYTIYAISNYANWQKDLMTWMASKKENEQIKKHIGDLNLKYRLNLQEVFPKYFRDQLVTFQLSTGEKFGAIALAKGEKVGQLLLDLSADYATDIKIFKEPYIPYAFFGAPLKKFERPFYTIIDNYLIMANNASSIQAFLNSYKNNSLLINDEDYISLNEQLSESATISFYVNRKNSNEIFGRNLKAPYYKQFQAKNGFGSYSAFCYQLTADRGKFQTNLLLYKKPEKKEVIDTIITNR